MYKPQYSITNNTLNFVSRVEACKDLIENAALVPSWERKFQEEALVRQAHHSTAIEENGLNFTEVKKVLSGEDVLSYRQRDIKEIINYRKAVNMLESYNADLNLDIILDINRTLLEGLVDDSKIGVLRDVDVMIVNSKTSDLVMEPPLKDEIKYLIDDLVEWYNTDKLNHPIIKSGIIQFELTSIHPFIDGNGRTARLLSTWSLYSTGYKVNKFFSIEEYYDRDSKAYYSALASADDGGDLTTWLEFYTKGLAIEFERIKDKVLALSQDRVLKNRLGQQIALNERQIKILNYINERGFLQNQDFNSIFPNISDDTVLREIKDLLKKKIIKKTGRTRAAKYILK